LLVDSKTHKLKLCDFGFARCLQKHDDSAVTEYVATRWYRAPELLVGTNKHTGAVDVWPVGCIWVEMCSAEPLFPGDSEIDQLYIVQEGLGSSLPQTLMKFFVNNAKYQGLTLPNQDLYSNNTTISLRYRLQKQHGVSLEYFNQSNRLELLVDMLRLDPENRITIDDAIYQIENPDDDRKQERPDREKRDQRRRPKRFRVKGTKDGPGRDRSPSRKLKLPHVMGQRRTSIVGGGGVLSELLDIAGYDSDGNEENGIVHLKADNSNTSFHKKSFFMKKKTGGGE